MPAPSEHERTRLREAILLHVATIPANRTIVAALFANDGKTARAADFVKLFPRGAMTEGAIRRRVSDINRRLSRFFAENANTFPTRVRIERFQLRFEANVAIENRDDFRAEFWSRYFDSDEAIHMLYPEPEFFLDERLTYLRNPAAMESDVREAFGYLNTAGTLERAYSFVPSGIVRAMLFLVEMFQEQQVPIRATPVWPFTPGNDPEANVIVLGTPTTSVTTVTLEDGRAAHSTPDGIRVGEALKYSDAHPEDTTGEKWGLVTRRAHRFDGRQITVVSAKHGRTIQAITQFLTRRDDMDKLAPLVRETGGVSRELQIVFRVNMSKGAGEPRIDRVEPVEIL